MDGGALDVGLTVSFVVGGVFDCGGCILWAWMGFSKCGGLSLKKSFRNENPKIMVWEKKNPGIRGPFREAGYLDVELLGRG